MNENCSTTYDDCSQPTEPVTTLLPEVVTVNESDCERPAHTANIEHTALTRPSVTFSPEQLEVLCRVYKICGPSSTRPQPPPNTSDCAPTQPTTSCSAPDLGNAVVEWIKVADDNCAKSQYTIQTSAALLTSKRDGLFQFSLSMTNSLGYPLTWQRSVDGGRSWQTVALNSASLSADTNTGWLKDTYSGLLLAFNDQGRDLFSLRLNPATGASEIVLIKSSRTPLVACPVNRYRLQVPPGVDISDIVVSTTGDAKVTRLQGNLFQIEGFYGSVSAQAKLSACGETVSRAILPLKLFDCASADTASVIIVPTATPDEFLAIATIKPGILKGDALWTIQGASVLSATGDVQRRIKVTSASASISFSALGECNTINASASATKSTTIASTLPATPANPDSHSTDPNGRTDDTDVEDADGGPVPPQIDIPKTESNVSTTVSTQPSTTTPTTSAPPSTTASPAVVECARLNWYTPNKGLLQVTAPSGVRVKIYRADGAYRQGIGWDSNTFIDLSDPSGGGFTYQINYLPFLGGGTPGLDQGEWFIEFLKDGYVERKSFTITGGTIIDIKLCAPNTTAPTSSIPGSTTTPSTVPSTTQPTSTSDVPVTTGSVVGCGYFKWDSISKSARVVGDFFNGTTVALIRRDGSTKNGSNVQVGGGDWQTGQYLPVRIETYDGYPVWAPFYRGLDSSKTGVESGPYWLVFKYQGVTEVFPLDLVVVDNGEANPVYTLKDCAPPVTTSQGGTTTTTPVTSAPPCSINITNVAVSGGDININISFSGATLVRVQLLKGSTVVYNQVKTAEALLRVPVSYLTSDGDWTVSVSGENGASCSDYESFNYTGGTTTSTSTPPPVTSKGPSVTHGYLSAVQCGYQIDVKAQAQPKIRIYGTNNSYNATYTMQDLGGGNYRWIETLPQGSYTFVVYIEGSTGDQWQWTDRIVYCEPASTQPATTAPVCSIDITNLSEAANGYVMGINYSGTDTFRFILKKDGSTTQNFLISATNQYGIPTSYFSGPGNYVVRIESQSGQCYDEYAFYYSGGASTTQPTTSTPPSTTGVPEADKIGYLNIDVTYGTEKDLAQYGFRMVMVSNAGGLNGVSIEPGNSGRFIPASASIPNLVAVAPLGKSDSSSTAYTLDFYRFALNLAYLRANYPGVHRFYMQVYGRKIQNGDQAYQEAYNGVFFRLNYKKGGNMVAVTPFNGVDFNYTGGTTSYTDFYEGTSNGLGVTKKITSQTEVPIGRVFVDLDNNTAVYYKEGVATPSIG